MKTTLIAVLMAAFFAICAAETTGARRALKTTKSTKVPYAPSSKMPKQASSKSPKGTKEPKSTKATKEPKASTKSPEASTKSPKQDGGGGPPIDPTSAPGTDTDGDATSGSGPVSLQQTSMVAVGVAGLLWFGL